MSQTDIFVIEYKHHGQPKSFIIRAKTMRNADAWHWASCDAGLAPIPKPGRPPVEGDVKTSGRAFRRYRGEMARDRRISLGRSLGILALPQCSPAGADKHSRKMRHCSRRAEPRRLPSRAMKKLERRKLGTTPMR